TAHAQLRGHGGPVRALAISPDGKQAVSGSFDTSAIRWSLARNAAEQVLRFHDGAVNAAVFLRDGRIATSGEDARIGIWRPGEPRPAQVLAGHEGPVRPFPVTRRSDARLRLLGSYRAAVAARWRRAALDRGPCSECQRRCIRARWPRARHRGL